MSSHRTVNMLSEVECSCHVVIPLKDLDKNEQVPQSLPQRLIVTCLLKQMSKWKSTEDYGYFVAVTKLVRIGTGKVDESSRYIIFPVCVHCRTFLPRKGEIMFGVVYRVNRYGVFLKSGPMRCIYLSASKIPSYTYVDSDENPFYVNSDQSRIETDVVLRFVVFATRWTLKDNFVEREFKILASLEGNSLGPVSLAGHDGLAL